MTNVVQFSAGDDKRTHARRLTDAIKTTAEHLSDLIAQAFTEAVWTDLDYADWEAYCEAEFGTTLRVNAVERRDVASHLRAIGMSNYAIGSALGVTEGTIRADLRPAQDHHPRKHYADDDHGSDELDGSEQGHRGSESDAVELDDPDGWDDDDDGVIDDDDEIVDAVVVDDGLSSAQTIGPVKGPKLIDRVDKIIGQTQRLTDALEKLTADKRWPNERRAILARSRVALAQLEAALGVVNAK